MTQLWYSFSFRQRRHLTLVHAAIAAGFFTGLVLSTRLTPVRAQDKKPFTPELTTTAAPLTEMKIIEQVTAATNKGLAYLASKQRPDGGWHDNHAVNGLATLAFLGCGQTPGRGPYKDVLEKSKKYLIAAPLRSNNPAFISFSTMYEHGMATLALAEMYGMDSDPALEEKVRAAVDLIVRVQSPGGGWNYAPNPGDGDLSVSVMQIVALRAANNAEIPVKQQVIDKAIKYVRAHAQPGNGGGYGYNGPGQGPQTTAAGILSLQLLGKFDDPNIPPSLKYLNQFQPLWGPGATQYFYYFHYYAIQAKYQAGGADWNDWHPRIRDLLLDKQNKENGSWDVPPGTAEAENVVGPNKVYWTAMACLVLDIYMHYLPAYQR